MSISTVQFSTETGKHLDTEIKKMLYLDPKCDTIENDYSYSFHNEFSIGLVIAIAMAAFGSFTGIRCVSKKKRVSTAIPGCGYFPFGSNFSNALGLVR